MKRRSLTTASSIIDPRSSLRREALQVGRRRLVARVGAVARLDHAKVQTVHPQLKRTPVVGEHAPLGNVPGAGAGVGARVGDVELARLARLEGEAVLEAPAHAATAVDAHTPAGHVLRSAAEVLDLHPLVRLGRRTAAE